MMAEGPQAAKEEKRATLRRPIISMRTEGPRRGAWPHLEVDHANAGLKVSKAPPLRPLATPG